MSSGQSSNTLTQGVRVHAIASFLADRSEPDRKSYIFAYRITIDNEGDTPVRLLARHWIIINGDGAREEVRGEGVVGETPELAPGESFSYTSYCPMATYWGTMEGSYTMERLNGDQFEAVIGRFFLVADVNVRAEMSS